MRALLNAKEPGVTPALPPLAVEPSLGRPLPVGACQSAQRLGRFLVLSRSRDLQSFGCGEVLGLPADDAPASAEIDVKHLAHVPLFLARPFLTTETDARRRREQPCT